MVAMVEERLRVAGGDRGDQARSWWGMHYHGGGMGE